MKIASFFACALVGIGNYTKCHLTSLLKKEKLINGEREGVEKGRHRAAMGRLSPNPSYGNSSQ